MHWAKTQQAARFNLANSGLYNYPIAQLPVTPADLELSGPSFYGYEPLQRALAKHLAVPCENIVHAEGTSMANHLAMAVAFEPGDDVLIEYPTYELLLSTASYLGARIGRFRRPAEHGFALDLDELKRALTPRTKLVVLTNLHNPSSAFIDDDTMRAAAELAASVGARLLVDEVYLDAAFELAPKTSQRLAPNILVSSSLTKVYGLSGLRCGWVIAPPDIAQRIWRLIDLFGVIPSHAAERLSVIALENMHRLVAHSRGLLTTNRALLNDFFASRRDLEVAPMRFGTVAFPRLKSGQVERLCQILRSKYETSVVPGHFFEMPEHFRVGIGRATADVTEGLARLGRALDEV